MDALDGEGGKGRRAVDPMVRLGSWAEVPRIFWAPAPKYLVVPQDMFSVVSLDTISNVYVYIYIYIYIICNF